MKKFSWLKKDNPNKPVGKRWKNYTLFLCGVITFVAALFGLATSNYHFHTVIKTVNVTTSQSSNSSLNSIELATEKIKEWKLDETSKSFLNVLNSTIHQCNDKNYVQSIIGFCLTNEQHELVKKELKKVGDYFNQKQTKPSFLTVNNNQELSNQFVQIIKNTNVHVNSFIDYLITQKNALGAVGLIIGLITAIIAFLGLNYAIFIPTLIINLTGMCCAASSDGISCIIFNYLNENQSIYYSNNTPPSLSELPFWITEVLPYFQNLKSTLEQNSCLFGTKAMLNFVNQSIDQLENMLATLNQSDN